VDEVPTPSELRVAARAATIVAYGTGLAGIGLGTWLQRQDDLVMAILVWVITFAVGACLISVATLVRASAGVTARLAKLDADVASLRRDRLRD
jgi:FtsH-binding integral membrane protein